MEPLTEAQIRSSFVNTSRSDAERVPMPGLHEVLWSEREYLGWHDARAPQRAYLTVWKGDRPVSLVLRAADRSIRRGISAICSLCHMPQPGGQVVLVGVVPGMEARMRTERLDALAAEASRLAPPITTALNTSADRRRLDALVRRTADVAGARVTLFGVTRGSEGVQLYVATDSTA